MQLKTRAIVNVTQRLVSFVHHQSPNYLKISLHLHWIVLVVQLVDSERQEIRVPWSELISQGHPGAQT